MNADFLNTSTREPPALERQCALVGRSHRRGQRRPDTDAGFVVDGFEEPGFTPKETPRPAVKWEDMPDVPPILVVRMRLAGLA
jgi:hypothetical protein